MVNESHARQIHVAGRSVRCDTNEDRALLMQAKSVEINPAFAGTLTNGQLYLIKDACQKYSLGKHQRLVRLAIEGREHLGNASNLRKWREGEVG